MNASKGSFFCVAAGVRRTLYYLRVTELEGSRGSLGSGRHHATCTGLGGHRALKALRLTLKDSRECKGFETSGTSHDDIDTPSLHSKHARSLETSTDSCQYEGRYFPDGEVVVTREACLRCRCGRGAISCRRKSCEPLPDPPPTRCHVSHRRESCCPELHCRGGDIPLERSFSNYEEEYPDTATAPNHVCVEGGTAYSAGSAMSSGTACEQCFCLGGTRRCVRPQCLPPPLGCKARPSPGACCPQRYYCEHGTTKPPGERHLHDCYIDGKWVPEGQRVSSPNDRENCSQCFCLRGSVRCQSMACAPALMGCKPILAPGQCCPHQYQCDHHYRRGLPGFHLQPIIDNALISIRNQDRSFRNAPENQTLITTNAAPKKTTPAATTVHKEPITTIKVKRKTNDDTSLITTQSQKFEENVTTTIAMMSTTQSTILPTDVSTDGPLDDDATEQPDGSIKIMINGTINCTAELSSTAITVNTTSSNETNKLIDTIDIQPRIPNIGVAIESHTYNPNDIITDRNYNDDFDENESYTINVTSSLISSLRTNATISPTPASSTTASKPLSTDAFSASNISKKTKDDYDYNNYNKPTLPPSLPNLKIIPFVAADAVVDDEISSKESLTYPMLERDDKYPVYYPSVEAKDPPFATRREDLYNPTQFPIFLSKKVESPHYPLSAHGVDLTNEYPSSGDIITSLQDFTVTASLGGNSPHSNKEITKLTNQSTSQFELQTPAVNLFSPPVETEGGFIPKDPEIIDDYYAIYPTTPPGSVVPHLTTSMQLDSTKSQCVTGDGRRILEGESVTLACSICTCAWGDLHCSQRSCHNPPGCKRRPTSTSSTDLCCGDLICNQDNGTTPSPLPTSTRSLQITLNSTKTEKLNDTGRVTESSLNKNSTAYFDLNSVSKSDTLNLVSTAINNRTETAEVNNSNNIMDNVHTTEGSLYSKTTVNLEELNTGSSITQEYDEEEEDEGFSFGSVLKLLLSDSYDTTTLGTTKPSTAPITSRPVPMSTTTPTITIKKQPPPPLPSLATLRPSYQSPLNQQSPNTIYRIDHLVLGESTAIKKTTPRTTTVPFKPIVQRKPPPIKKPATQKPTIASKPTEVTKKTDLEREESIQPSLFTGSGVLGGGLLKLAGCNIYGQMYRVGRIIAELSTPCQECRCTEIGVQCRQLDC